MCTYIHAHKTGTENREGEKWRWKMGERLEGRDRENGGGGGQMERGKQTLAGLCDKNPLF